MKLDGVHHIAVICSDRERSLEFYCGVLGLRVVKEHFRSERDSWKIDLALGDCYVVELFTFPSPPPRVSNPEACGLRHLAFAVRDIEDARDELSRKGVAHEELRTDEYTGKRFFFLRDPDGLPIEIYET